MSQPDYKPQQKYDAANTTKVTIKLNLKTDADIVEYLSKSSNKQGTIKDALRKAINK